MLLNSWISELIFNETYNWHHWQQVQFCSKIYLTLTFGAVVEVMYPQLYPLEQWRHRNLLLQFWDLKCTERVTLVPLNPRRPSSPQNTSLLISWSKQIVSDRYWFEMRFLHMLVKDSEVIGSGLLLRPVMMLGRYMLCLCSSLRRMLNCETKLHITYRSKTLNQHRKVDDDEMRCISYLYICQINIQNKSKYQYICFCEAFFYAEKMFSSLWKVFFPSL